MARADRATCLRTQLRSRSPNQAISLPGGRIRFGARVRQLFERPCEAGEFDDRSGTSGRFAQPAKRGRSIREAGGGARAGRRGIALVANRGARPSRRISRSGPGRILRAHQRQAARLRLPLYRYIGAYGVVPLGDGPSHRASSRRQACGCNVSVTSRRSCESRGRIRAPGTGKPHSSIDAPPALSHRVGRIAARLIGCVPRPIRTAVNMSSDSSSSMSMSSPAVAGA
jgi:hypothetical protein